MVPFGRKLIAIVRPSVACIVVGLTAIFAPQIPPARAENIGILIRQLDRTEWEIVSDAVSKQLPNLVFTSEEQAQFKKLLKHSQEMAAMADAVRYGDYSKLGEISSGILNENIDKLAEQRFGKDSRVYKTIEFVRKNPALAKELTRAALNLDSDAAASAMKKAVKEFAKKRMTELQKQGQTFWKNLLLDIVPGGRRLTAIGLNPVDIYLQALYDFKDFTKATRLRFNNTALDCLALRYRKIRSEGGSASLAREIIEDFDTGTGFGRSFDCAKERDKQDPTSGTKSVTQKIADFFRTFGRTTAAQGELKLTSSEIVTLIELYEHQGGPSKHQEFSEWLQDRLMRNISVRAERLELALIEEQKRIAAQRIKEAKKVVDAIEAEIAKLDKKKPEQPNRTPTTKNTPPPSGTDKERGGDKNRTAGKKDSPDKTPPKKQPEEPKSTAECDRLRTQVQAIERKIIRGKSGPHNRALEDLASAEQKARQEGNCPADIFAAASAARTKIQDVGSLRQELETAIRNCNIGALSSLTAKTRKMPQTTFLNEVTLLQTAKTGVDAFNKGRAASDAGRYSEARTFLQRAQSALKELPSGACQTYADRTQAGLTFLDQIDGEIGRVNNAITRCETAELRKIIAQYGKKKHRFFRNNIPRIKAAYKECQEKDRIIAQGKFCEEARSLFSSAAADYGNNNLTQASGKLNRLKRQLTNKKAKRCPELAQKVQVGLAKIQTLRENASNLHQALKGCDFNQLRSLTSAYRNQKHLWFKVAVNQLTARLKSCQQKTVSRENAIADCRRQVAAKGKVYATTKFHQDGSYNCHWCEPGFKSNGSACIPDVAKAEAQCRQLAARQGKVHGEARILQNGTFDCLWCEPGQVYQNGQCGSPQAHAEADCRRQAAARGKVYATTRFLKNGQYRCFWCERGQIFATDGKCWTRTALAEADCRHKVARMGKVFGRVVFQRNGQYQCLWCQPGQYFSRGRCYSPQRNTATGAAIIGGILNELQRQQNRRQPVRNPRISPQTRKPTQRAPRRPAAPANCIKNGFINMTDPRCKKYW